MFESKIDKVMARETTSISIFETIFVVIILISVSLIYLPQLSRRACFIDIETVVIPHLVLVVLLMLIQQAQ